MPRSVGTLPVAGTIECQPRKAGGQILGFLESQLEQLRSLSLSKESWQYIDRLDPEARPLLERVIEGYTLLDTQPEDELPDNLANTAVNQLDSLIRYLPSDEGVDPVSPNARETVSGFRGQLNSVWQLWRNQARPAIRIDEVRVASLVVAAESDVRLITAARDKAEVIADQLRDLAAVAGTLELSKHYADRARKHLLASRWALGFVVALSAVLVFGGYSLIANIPHTTEWTVLTRDVLARGFMIGALTYLITFSARVYRTNAHLKAVYEQKVSALQTFGVFQSAVDGDDAKVLLLTELVHSVFASADTGVFGKDGDTTTIVDAATPVVAALTRTK